MKVKTPELPPAAPSMLSEQQRQRTEDMIAAEGRQGSRAMNLTKGIRMGMPKSVSLTPRANVGGQ